MSRTLVVFYSRSGTTQAAAEALADALGADSEAIVDRRSRAGIAGYLRSALEAMRGRDAAIAQSRQNPAAYDLLVIGSPVWYGAVSSPVRAYLRRHASRVGNVAFFCTKGGRGGPRVFRQMAQLCGRQPVAVLELTARQVREGTHFPAIERFAEQLKLTAPAATRT